MTAVWAPARLVLKQFHCDEQQGTVSCYYLALALVTVYSAKHENFIEIDFTFFIWMKVKPITEFLYKI